MLTMDAFRADAFAAVSLTAAVDKMSYTPELLGQIPGLFTPRPVRTTAIWIEERSNGPALILTQPRSAPPKVRGAEIRDARSFIAKALGESARIMADELQGIRAFGSETEMKQLMTEVARRQFLIKKDFELTKENWRLTCLQGALLDADGSTIYNWNSEFNQPQASEVNWDLQNASPASGIIRQMCNQTIRHVKRKLQGVGGPNVKVAAICGDEFWDAFTAHVEVRQTFLNWTAAAELRRRQCVGHVQLRWHQLDQLSFDRRWRSDAARRIERRLDHQPDARRRRADHASEVLPDTTLASSRKPMRRRRGSNSSTRRASMLTPGL